MGNLNVISVIIGIFAWMAIVIFTFRILKKQSVKPKVWKALVILFVGIFSFTINFDMFNTLVKLPILPLGVWILYFIFRQNEEKWQVYRSYAWLGFFANFIFLIATLMTIPIHDVSYPKDNFPTYISNVDNASINRIHPSAHGSLLNKDKLLKQIDHMSQDTIYSQEWYRDTYVDTETNRKTERFPYQLIGTKTKWGSGINTMIFIEEDGRGFLILASQKQLYFRSEYSFIEGRR